MKKKQNRNQLSLNDIYEMETDNKNEYTTENFDSLEFSEDIDFKDQNKEYVDEINIPLNKNKK